MATTAPSCESRPTAATEVILAAIAGCAALALLPWLGKPSFPDEHASIAAARLGWTLLWRDSQVVDLVLLPYYSLLHVWLGLSADLAWARALSLIAFGLTVFLVGHIGARLGGRLCGSVAAVVAATDPLFVTAALSARPYALSTLAATAAGAAFLRWRGGGTMRWAWLFCAASTATLLVHLFAVLAPLSLVAASLVLEPALLRGRRRDLAAPVAIVLAAAVAVAGLGWGQRRQLDWIPAPFEGAQLLRALEGPAASRQATYAVLVLVAVLLGVAASRWHRGGPPPHGPDLRLLGIMVTWAVLPAALLVAGSLVRPVFLDRYVTASVPGLALALGLSAAAVAVRLEARRPASRPVFRAAALAGAAVILFTAFSMPAARLTYAEAISARASLAERIAASDEAADQPPARAGPLLGSGVR